MGAQRGKTAAGREHCPTCRAAGCLLCLSFKKEFSKIKQQQQQQKGERRKKKTEKQQLSEDFCSGSGGEKSQIVIGNLNNVLEYKMSLLQLILQVLSEIQLSATFLSDLY